MKTIFTIYGLFCYHLFLIGLGLYVRFGWDNYALWKFNSIWSDVSLFGLAGGSVYCLRGLYLHYCVEKDWDNVWFLWHLARPFVSTVCGVVSLVFVKAGLLLFGGASIEMQNHYGVYALAFIAGLNVDNFVKKIELIFKEAIGIEQTRTSGEK